MATPTLVKKSLAERLYTLTVLVDRYQLDADEVTIKPDGITITGDVAYALPDLTMALMLERDTTAPGEVYRGETFDGIPVTVEHRRA